MNYTLYLQQGGSAQPSIEEQVAQLVQAAMSGDKEAAQQIEQIMQAAQQGNNPKAQQLAQLIQQITLKLQSENPESMKCGGKVRAKIKKACGGKKMEKGGEALVKKEAKGGKPCPCTLHKVGGKLIEVDCNGIPVAKNGAVLFAKLGDGLHPVNAQLDVNPNLFGGTNYRSQYLWGNGGNNTTIKVPTKSVDTPEQSKGASYYMPQGKMAASKFIYDVMRKPSKDNTWTYMSERVLQGLAPVSETVLNEIETGKVTGKSPREVDQREAALLAEEMRRVQEFEAAQAAARERNAFGAGKQGKFGGLTYDEALARQNEMLAAKDQGFNVDLGRWGADGKWGNQSRSEWERYQQWKTAQSAQPQISAGERFVTEGYNSGRPWQDTELQNMDADQAIHLKAPDYNRWISLNFNQAQAKPYVAPASPVLNPNAPRKDIYNFSTARAPFAQINPIVAIRKDGGKFISYEDYLKL